MAEATQDISEDYRQSLTNADFLLREICQAGRHPSFADMTFFNVNAAGMNKRWPHNCGE